MTAKMIPVVPVTDAILTSSTVPENDFAVWLVGTTYAASTTGSPVKVIKGHLIWESVQAGNVGNDPEVDDGVWWTKLLATNRWSVFDGYIQNQATRATSAQWVVTPGEVINSVSLFNLNAASVQIVVTDPTDGVVYDETFSLTDTSNVIDAYSYFFAPIITRESLCVTDLPPYGSAAISVTVNTPAARQRLGKSLSAMQRNLAQRWTKCRSGLTIIRG